MLFENWEYIVGGAFFVLLLLAIANTRIPKDPTDPRNFDS